MSSIKTAILLLILAVPMTAAAQNMDCVSTRVGNTVNTTCNGYASPQPVYQAPMPLPALSIRSQQYQDPITTQARLQQLQLQAQQLRIQRMQLEALQAQQAEIRRLEEQQKEETRKREAEAQKADKP